MRTPIEPRPGTPRGLDPASVDAARRIHGANEIDAVERRGSLAVVRGVLAEPMFLLLLAAAALYLAFGDLGEGLLLGLFAVVSVALVVIQEGRGERALDALRALGAPQARAWRSGLLVRLPASELVPGDLVQLDEGGRVPADGRLLESRALAVDESLLTGESGPVHKDAQSAERSAVFAGTLVVAGHALCELTTTGRATRIGRIGESLSSIVAVPSPMALQLRQVARRFAAAGLLASAALTAWYGFTRGDWQHGMLAGIALAMAMLPEEFPMAMTIFLALGAWRLARVKVLVRRPAAIDSLGATSMLCLDKTGTLTRNELVVVRTETPGAALSPTLLDAARLASRARAADPLDRAVFAASSLAATTVTTLLREYPLVPGRPLMAQAWQDGVGIRLAAKGAPEALLALCELDAAARQRWLDAAAAMAREGLRVIAVADAIVPAPPEALEQVKFTPQGLLGLEDPLRDDAAAAIAAARKAGVDAALITGDHAETALEVAARAGIEPMEGALAGSEIEALDDDGLAAAVRHHRVFARISPEQKLRLVRAFQAQGHVVAMTGDGVNDAPALKAAHVGIAMGARGTDVAREAAQIVLLDDGIGRIVEGLAVGRRIFDNLRRVMVYIVAIHVPIAGAALVPALLGLPPLLLPVHVVLTEMVIDPMCSLVFENAPARPRLMDEPPRGAGRPLVDRRVLLGGLLQGTACLITVLATYLLALHADLDASQARALAVVALTAGNLGLAAANAGSGLGWRGMFRREFLSFWIVVLLATAMLGLGLYLPAAQALLQIGQPPAAGLLLVLAAALGMVLMLARVRTALSRSRQASHKLPSA